MLHGEREHLEDEAFFLSILLFLVLVSLDDFSYAGLSLSYSLLLRSRFLCDMNPLIGRQYL